MLLEGSAAALGRRAFWARLLFATVFPHGLPYNKPVSGKGGSRMTVVYLDSVFVLNGLMDYLLALCAARLAGIPLRRRRYLLAGLLGAGVPVRPAGESCGGGAAGAGGLWRGAEAAAADAAVLHRLLCHGRLRAGPGHAGGRRRAGGERHLLHGCGRQGAADCRGRGLSGADGGVPGGGREGNPGPPGAGPGVSPGPDGGPDRPLRHGEFPPGPGVGVAGAGGVSGPAGGHPPPAGPAAAGERGGPGPSAGAPGGGGAPAEVPAAALPGGGRGGRAAAGPAQRLGGGGGEAVRRADGGPVPHGAGNGIRRPVGRRGGKEHAP